MSEKVPLVKFEFDSTPLWLIALAALFAASYLGHIAKQMEIANGERAREPIQAPPARLGE